MADGNYLFHIDRDVKCW